LAVDFKDVVEWGNDVTTWLILKALKMAVERGIDIGELGFEEFQKLLDEALAEFQKKYRRPLLKALSNEVREMLKDAELLKTALQSLRRELKGLTYIG
jgi:polyhydroxyalkanoate synthesis regulator phasin